MIESATALVARWPTRPENESFSYESYHSSHVTAIVTSGLIGTEDPNDRQVLESLERYQQAIARFNAALRIVGRRNPGIFIKANLIHTTDTNVWPEKVDDALAEPFQNLVVTHRSAKQMLETSYPWVTRRAA